MPIWQKSLRELLKSIRRTVVSVISMTTVLFLLILNVTASWDGHIWEYILMHLGGGGFLWLAWLYLVKRDETADSDLIGDRNDWEVIENRLINLLSDEDDV
jgi:hypothetical protein